MPRKTTQTRKELEAAQQRLNEIAELNVLAAKEEEQTLSFAASRIDEMCKNDGLFCGVILTPDDLAAVVKLAIESKESIKIGFRLYFNEP